MIRRLPPFLIGALTVTGFFLNTVFCVLALYLVTLVKLLVPIRGFRQWCTHVLVWIAEAWIDGNTILMTLAHDTVWEVEIDPVDRHGSYLVVSNHRSSVDIPVLQRVLIRRIPFLRFFLKQELIYVPLLGLAWWALDFPFMKRYSREEVEKHPELRGKDLQNVRNACQKFLGQPVTIFNFLEGTRLTPEKHARFSSPYRHLLPPRAGGVASVLSAMGDRLDGILDLTVLYDLPAPSLWDFFCARVHRVVVHGRLVPVPAGVVGQDYTEDPEFRQRFQDWVNQIWREKDEWIAARLGRPV